MDPKILALLKSRVRSDREQGAHQLQEQVRLVHRDNSAELSTIFAAVYQLINSDELAEKQGGIMAVDDLIGVSVSENETKIIRFANYLRGVFMNVTDGDTLVLAASTLGHLAKAGGPMTSDFVEFEVKRALEWLRSDRDSWQLAAVLIISELAENTPALFYQYISPFFKNVWSGLSHSDIRIREASASALCSCLKVVAQRRNEHKTTWFGYIFEIARESLSTKSNPEAVHGALLSMGELLHNTGSFMDSRFSDVCELVLKYKDGKEKFVRRTVIALFPRLARFRPDGFYKEHSRVTFQHLLAAVKQPAERATAFIAVGRVAVEVSAYLDPADFNPVLTKLIACIHDALTPKKSRGYCPEALTCAAMLSRAVREQLTEYLHDLLAVMFNIGLCKILIHALSEIAENIPALVPLIQERLLRQIAQALGTPVMAIGSRAPAVVATEAEKRKNLCLALQTLGSFNFTGVDLLPLAAERVVPFLDDDDTEVRRSAGVTCAKVILQRNSASSDSALLGHAPSITLVTKVLMKLLQTAVADPDAGIRRTILASLDARMDPFLCQSDHLRPLFIVLHDEDMRVREAALNIVGRLTHLNPALVMPALRKTLLQLLTELDYSQNAVARESAASLLGRLIRSSQRLVGPYVPGVIRTLVPKLKDDDTGVSSAVLAAIGELVVVASDAMLPFMDTLIPEILASLRTSQSSDAKLETGVRTLGLLIENTGHVILPYLDHPQLLSTLLEILQKANTSVWSLRREALRTLGILGAIDPYRQTTIAQSRKLMSSATRGAGLLTITGIGVEKRGTPLVILPSSVSDPEDYYPTVAVVALLRILAEPSLTMHHNQVLTAIVWIFRSLGARCVSFLHQVIPSLIQMVKGQDESGRDSTLRDFASIINLVHKHIRPYAADVVGLALDVWPRNVSALLKLLESLAAAIPEDFKTFLPELIPRILAILNNSRSQDTSVTRQVLHTFVALGNLLVDFLHLIIPGLTLFFEDLHCPPAVRKTAIGTLGQMSISIPLAEYASRIVHPIIRLLNDSTLPNDVKVTCVDVMCLLTYQMRQDFLVFVPTIQRALASNRLQHDGFCRLVEALLSNDPLPARDVLHLQLDLSRYVGHIVVDSSLTEPSDVKKLSVNQEHLKRAWEVSQRSTKEDWTEWMRRLSVELLRESPSPALRACHALAQVLHSLARELFNAAFVSCWTELHEPYQDYLVQSLETAFSSPTIPPEILQMLLNLAEFMEHDEKALPIDIRTLGDLASKCHAYAKALHYKELEFHTSPKSCIEDLISINNQLEQPEAAIGVLTFAQQQQSSDVSLLGGSAQSLAASVLGGSAATGTIQVEESWFEKLGRWDEALQSYQDRLALEPSNPQLLLGQLRCFKALGEWRRLLQAAHKAWDAEFCAGPTRTKIAGLAARAAWAMGRWDSMALFAQATPQSTVKGNFFRAVLAIHREQFGDAKAHIDECRKALSTELIALVGESYSRAYRKIVTLQQLSEMEEILLFLRLKSTNNHHMSEKYIKRLKAMWERRLFGCQRNIGVWYRILSVRSLLSVTREDQRPWIKFASLCRRSGRPNMALQILVGLTKDMSLFHSVVDRPFASTKEAFQVVFENCMNRNANAAYAFLKHSWDEQEHEFSIRGLERLVDQLGSLAMEASSALTPNQLADLHVRTHLRLGDWKLAEAEKSGQLDPAADESTYTSSVKPVLAMYLRATQHGPAHYKAWHSWAMLNFQTAHFLSRKHGSTPDVTAHVESAVKGFFSSISLGRTRLKAHVLQDLLRLLTLWFGYGSDERVHSALESGLGTVPVDTWLQVIPQLIARIHVKSTKIQQLLHSLLNEVGKVHPQALIYPLTVAATSSFRPRKTAATTLMDKLRLHSSTLVDQAALVSRELIRVAILWPGLWISGLEEASKLWFGEQSNVDAMLDVLIPLHEMIMKSPATAHESAFIQQFGHDLAHAYDWLMKYQRTHSASDVQSAWDIYYRVFKVLQKQVASVTSLELQNVSPLLLAAEDMSLAIPGTYAAGEEVVRIASFHTHVGVIQSKQRPRKITLQGSDGSEYSFLLKGHEDLRQDERVMQLFGLVNTLLQNDPDTSKRDLSIRQYSVTPLSHNAGVVGWVPDCDTLHQLIREYRESRKILLNIEQRLMQQMAPMYDSLTLLQRVEVFRYALDNTTGQDLYKVLWLKSANSEVWLDRRTNYTRSLAVMSIVGYILGLGDRHPSNLMLDRHSGKILHIDFGDCFEVAMHREKFPERIPFRLTRMLINAMEVSGIEGNYRSTCESVMTVLREHRDSVMAMLEAFVHDPLINWRLLGGGKNKAAGRTAAAADKGKEAASLSQSVAAGGLAEADTAAADAHVQFAPGSIHGNRGDREREMMQALGPEGSAAPAEALNDKAIAVIDRIHAKLTGKDFADREALPVPAQVQRLIAQATSHENLCQCYMGWCPFW